MSEPVRKLTDGELREAQGTPGLTRRKAFEGDGHWFGHVEAAPVTMSGWHHHGDNVTMGYVLKGSIRSRLRFRQALESSAPAIRDAHRRLRDAIAVDPRLAP